MDDTPTIAAARHFLRALRQGPPPSDTELAQALDELAVAYHQAPEGDPADDESDPPGAEYADYKERYASLRERFSGLGLYAVADPTEPVNEEPLVGDAIDDLADIEGDLQNVLWRFENLGPNDAHWHFRFLYQIHWGRHLRELSQYLHAKIW